MGSSLTVDLPTVSAAIGGNARGHWRKKHRAFQEAKGTAVVLMRAALNERGLYGDVLWTPVTVQVVWLYSSARYRPDLDNAFARVKPYIDAAVSVALLPDDGPDHIVGITMEYERAKKPGIRMTFTQVQERQVA